MKKVYIASPYTIGDVAVNVKRQMDVADKLMNEGFAPFAPLYSHFQHMAHPRPYKDWIEVDKTWVLACDCVLRLDGESEGADLEVRLAEQNEIPVFYSIKDLLEAQCSNELLGLSTVICRLLEQCDSDKMVIGYWEGKPYAKKLTDSGCEYPDHEDEEKIKL